MLAQRAVRRAAAVDLQRLAVDLHVGAPHVRGRRRVHELDAVGLAAPDHRFLFRLRELAEAREVVHPLLRQHETAARARAPGRYHRHRARLVPVRILGAVDEACHVARIEPAEAVQFELERRDARQRATDLHRAGEVEIVALAVQPHQDVALRAGRGAILPAEHGVERDEVLRDILRREPLPRIAAEGQHEVRFGRARGDRPSQQALELPGLPARAKMELEEVVMRRVLAENRRLGSWHRLDLRGIVDSKGRG